MTTTDPETARYGTGAVLIGGGSGGIGSAIARRFARAGARVALTYHRNRSAAEQIAEDVHALGSEALYAPVDLTQVEEVEAFVAQTADHFGGIHTLVYAAGPLLRMSHLSQLDPGVFRDTVGIDLFGCYNLVHSGLMELRKARGALVALGTPATERYAVRDLLSAAPKAAIESVVRAVAAEEGRFGVRANQVGVGAVEAGMFNTLKSQGELSDDWVAATERMVALGRLGTADDIANAVEFLASDRASYITGAILMVDGGWTAI